METKYFVAKAVIDIEPVLKKAIPLLKGSVGVITTIQYLHLMPEVKKFLEKNKIKTEILGQVLGCNTKVTDNSKADTILYIGDGVFHPKAMAIKKEKVNAVIANPHTMETRKLSDKEIKEFEQRRYAGLAKFYSSKNIGVLVTLKPGQERINEAVKLRKKFKDKNFYILLGDTFDFQSLEDFKFIDCFVNTMCPRIGYDDYNRLPKPVVNLIDLMENISK